MTRPVVVCGFGAFQEVVDNPSARLARAIDGSLVDGTPVIGCEMPVSYTRGVERAVAMTRMHQARLLLGIGVARTRTEVCVEAVGWPTCGPHADVDGVSTISFDPAIPVTASIDVESMAQAMNATVSTDAGHYVCNGWLHRTVSQLSVPVGFIHIPPAGMAPERFLLGIQALLAAHPAEQT